MAASLGHVLAQIQRWTSPHLEVMSDAILLERFAQCRDESAFAALVARHGPMVLRSCHLILGDVHEAEDAFQATFLILARKAHALKQPDALAGWLYGVARRVSLKARRKAFVCTSQMPLAEDLLDAQTDPLAQLTARELLTVLEEEVGRLPAAHLRQSGRLDNPAGLLSRWQMDRYPRRRHPDLGRGQWTANSPVGGSGSRLGFSYLQSRRHNARGRRR